jgi:HipA-like C-terminal domain
LFLCGFGTKTVIQWNDDEISSALIYVSDFERRHTDTPAATISNKGIKYIVPKTIGAVLDNYLIKVVIEDSLKNYALLLGSGGAVRLAPFYDLASILPYQTVDLQKAKLAMKIGGEYRLRNIGFRNWKKFALDLRLQEGLLIERIRAIAGSLPDHAATIQNELETAGLLSRGNSGMD